MNEPGRAFPLLWLNTECVPVKVQVCVLLPAGSLGQEAQSEVWQRAAEGRLEVCKQSV